ncbi:MAG: hypothetical protein WDN24_15170 [Sphingomonas sp.]
MPLIHAGLLLAAGDCFAAARDLPADAAIARSRSCPRALPGRTGSAARSATSPAAGAAIAARPIAAGAYLGRIALPSAGRVARGEALVLRSAQGAVTIERPVTALQPGRPGGRLFVRDGRRQGLFGPAGDRGRAMRLALLLLAAFRRRRAGGRAGSLPRRQLAGDGRGPARIRGRRHDHGDRPAGRRSVEHHPEQLAARPPT